MTLGLNRRAVGTFSNYRDAEAALHELGDSGFSMDQVSIVGRDVDHHSGVAGANAGQTVTEGAKRTADDTHADEGAKTGAIAGGALGGLTGLLVGLGALAIPGIGPVMVGGAVATALATTLSGGAIGAAAGGLVGGLTGLGIPEDRARMYSDRVSHGSYLIMVEGSEEEIQRAHTILHSRGIQDWDIFDNSTSTTTTGATYSTTDRTGSREGML